MTYQVTLRQRAEADLDSLYEFIARGSPQGAIDFTRRIRSECESLKDFPERGTRREDLGKGLRVLGFERRAVIVFRIVARRVQVVRIFYGGRDYENLLRRRS